jgi:hypothetical protein
MTCIICGSPRPANRQKFCSDACEAEGNRRLARERYRRTAREKRTEQAVKLPRGQWFRAVCQDEDEQADWLPPHREYSREAVRDFVAHGAPLEWFQPIGGNA